MVAKIIAFENTSELLPFSAMAPPSGPYIRPAAHSPLS
jgi:hypothetical protein